MLKKWKKGALLAAAAIMVAALAFVACKNIEDGGEIQPPAPEQGASDESGGGAGSQGGGQKPGEVGNLGGEQNPSGNLGGEEDGDDVPDLEYVYEVDSVSMPNENISPKRVSEILGELVFDYTMTHSSTGAGYLQSRVSYENLPEEIKREIKFKETTENGGVERAREYEFPEDQKEIPFEIWHGGKSRFEKTLKNGNYNRAAITRKIIALLKEIIGEAEYGAISADVAAGNLTLTAEKIKALGDFFPALEECAEAGRTAKDVENAAAILQNKEAFVAQAEGAIEVRFGPEYPDWYEEYPFLFDEETAEKKYVVTYKKGVVFDGEFNLSEISLPKNNGKGDFSKATLTNNGESIIINKLNTIRGSSLPELEFSNVTPNNDYSLSDSNDLYKLYKTYSEDLSKLENVKGNMDGFFVNGAIDEKDNFINGYTLFKADGNTTKDIGDETVKSLTIDALILMYKNLGINKFFNMIISGEPKKTTEVDWTLTNIVFEGDMSKITNKGTGDLKGIVYFEKKPYKNIDRSINPPVFQSVYGLLKLDSLEGVSYDTFGINLRNYSVLDVRGINSDKIESYNSDGSYGILAGGGYAHAIYFNDAFSPFKTDSKKIRELCYKFSKHPTSGAGFINAYFGEDRVNGESYNELIPNSIIGAKNPRKLKEFEDFGNYFENNYELKFNKTAKDTYKDDWDSLSDFDKGNLEKYLDEIAQNNGIHFRLKAKSVV